MHELAITQSIVEAVLDHTAGRQVATMRLKIGRLSGVVPSALITAVVLSGVALAVVAIALRSIPDVRRYLKIRDM